MTQESVWNVRGSTIAAPHVHACGKNVVFIFLHLDKCCSPHPPSPDHEAPYYEEITDTILRTPGHLELKENVAYGSGRQLKLEENVAYGIAYK